MGEGLLLLRVTKGMVALGDTSTIMFGLEQKGSKFSCFVGSSFVFKSVIF